MIVVAVLSTALSFYYLFFLLRIRKGLNNLTIPPVSTESPSVSIVISARNEQKTIKRCLESVFLQDYPENRYEVLVVDDGSDDRTAEIVRSLIPAHPRLRLLSLPNEKQTTGGRKPEAIAAAITESTGEIILTTDADCIVPPGWISGMAACFADPTGSSRGKPVAFVAGPVVERAAPGLLPALTRLEFLGIIAAGAGLIGAKRPIICNGANLAYRKSAFVAAGGFGEDRTSCDDETLMQRIITRKIGTVLFSGSPRTIVVTAEPESIRAFWQQRLRWASKRGHYEDRSILVELVLLYFYFFALFLFLIGVTVQPEMFTVFIFLLLGKVLVEYSVLSKAAMLFHQTFSRLQFFIAQVFHVPYIVAAGLFGQLTALTWKGTIIRR